MNRINTVGELRAVLAGLPDDAAIRPAIPSYVVSAPGLYVIRVAAGTCNAAFAEVVIEPQAYGVPGDAAGSVEDAIRAARNSALEAAAIEAASCGHHAVARRIRAMKDDSALGVALPREGQP